MPKKVDPKSPRARAGAQAERASRGGRASEAAPPPQGKTDDHVGLREGRQNVALSSDLPTKGFVLEAEDCREAMACRHVRGFREALAAARDPHALLPQRFVLVVPDTPMGEWLARWSEDVHRVRRTVTLARRLDGKRITAVTTLSSYGSGVDTALSIESIRTGSSRRTPALLRSGVHPKAAVDAALAGAGRRRARKTGARPSDGPQPRP